MSQIPQWLPPNLQAPLSKFRILSLIIRIKQIKYLQTLSHRAQLVRYKWWGLKNNLKNQPLYPLYDQVQGSKQNKIQSVHKFYVGVSLQMFQKYCTDMKVLEFQLCNLSQICIFKGYINFLLLKGWKGQQIQTIAEFKNLKSGAKIGQLIVNLQIIQIQNPFYRPCPQTIPKNLSDGEKNENNNINQMKNRRRQISKYQKLNESFDSQIKNQINFLNYDIGSEQNRNTQKQNQMTTKNNNNNPQNPFKMYGQNNMQDTKTRLYRKLNLPLPDSCICPSLNSNKYEIQKIKLKEDIQLFFNNTSEYFNNTASVQIQLIGWEPSDKKDISLPCKISIPILDNQGKIYANQYNFAKGKGVVNLNIDEKQVAGHNNQSYEQRLKDYLTNNELLINIGNAGGSVPLYKIMGSKGNIISVGIYEINKNKKQILKGHYFMKLIQTKTIAKQQPNHSNNNKGIQQLPQKPINKQQRQIVRQPEYMWLYLKQLHFLEPQYWLNSNIYIQIKTQQSEHKTKTIWKSESPVFNQILTIRIPSNKNNRQINVQFWNRQVTQRYIGKAVINLAEHLEYNVELPVFDYHNRTIAYIGLCIGKGDISQATQFLNTHSVAFYKHQQHNSNTVPYYSPRTQPVPSHDQQHQNEPQPSPHSHQNSQSQQQHQHDISSSEQHIKPSPYKPNPPPSSQSQQQISILQIHNRVFSKYIAKQYDWLGTYQNEHPTIAQFSHLIKPLCSNINIMKLASLYMDATNNAISLKELRQSFQAFQVYHNILITERNQVLSDVLESLNTRGISFNDVQSQISAKIKGLKNQNQIKNKTWRELKQLIQPSLVQKLRYFYQNCKISQLCDCFRKFQVFQTTKSQLLPTQLITTQILKQISDLLEVDNHPVLLKQAIKQAGLELSKYELLSLFGQILPKANKNLANKQKQYQMVKSPTFGLLTTDRVAAQPKIKHMNQRNIENNPSIDTRIQIPENQSQNKSGISNLSQKFGYPNISPINQQSGRNKVSVVSVKFMDIEQLPLQIDINGQQFPINVDDVGEDGILYLEVLKKFNYQGYVVMESGRKLQYDGPSGEWIGLVDQDGRYFGSICIQ